LIIEKLEILLILDDDFWRYYYYYYYYYYLLHACERDGLLALWMRD